MPLKTRKPTGLVAYPLLLLEGEEKAGKTFAALSLSRSERVGRTFILELDEPTADEYASLGSFEIIEHNGTFSSILDQLTEATKVPMSDDKPNVIILDSGSALWGLLKDRANSRARNSKRAREKLARDPDAEIEVTMPYWNDAKDRWYSVLNLLRGWPGIGIMTARGKQVAKVLNGQPVSGESEWSTEAEKSTPFAVSAVLRMTRPHVATVTAARSLNIDVGNAGQQLKVENPVEHLVFDVLGAGGKFQASSAIIGSVGKSIVEAKKELIAIFSRGNRPEQEARRLARDVWTAADLEELQEISDSQWQQLIIAATNKIVEVSNAKVPKDRSSGLDVSAGSAPEAAA